MEAKLDTILAQINLLTKQIELLDFKLKETKDNIMGEITKSTKENREAITASATTSTPRRTKSGGTTGGGKTTTGVTKFPARNVWLKKQYQAKNAVVMAIADKYATAIEDFRTSFDNKGEKFSSLSPEDRAKKEGDKLYELVKKHHYFGESKSTISDDIKVQLETEYMQQKNLFMENKTTVLPSSLDQKIEMITGGSSTSEQKPGEGVSNDNPFDGDAFTL
jgi:hypothetical protein